MSESDYSKEEDFEPSKESSEEDFDEEDEDFSEEKKPKKAKKTVVKQVKAPVEKEVKAPAKKASAKKAQVEKQDPVEKETPKEKDKEAPIQKEKIVTNSKRKAAPTVSEDINEVPKKVVKTQQNAVSQDTSAWPTLVQQPLPEIVNYKDAKEFIPPVNKGRVIKVYDGDTITIATRLDGFSSPEIYKFSVRINGIDTPEMKAHEDHEKNVAKLAQIALEKMIFGKDIVLKNVQFEKYGRLLCDVYCGDLHINKWMVDQRFALPYDGGTKAHPKSWERYYATGSME